MKDQDSPTMLSECPPKSPPDNHQVFRLMDLPAELREAIYLQACMPLPPLETNQPDIAKVPAIAQVSQQTRREALHVFYLNREIIISINSNSDIISMNGWLDSCGKNAYWSSKIHVSGRVQRGGSFTITITCSKKDPQFEVESRSSDEPSSSKNPARQKRRKCGSELILLEHEVTQYLENKASSRPADRRGRLTVGEVRSIINIVRKISGCG